MSESLPTPQESVDSPIDNQNSRYNNLDGGLNEDQVYVTAEPAANRRSCIVHDSCAFAVLDTRKVVGTREKYYPAKNIYNVHESNGTEVAQILSKAATHAEDTKIGLPNGKDAFPSICLECRKHARDAVIANPKLIGN